MLVRRCISLFLWWWREEVLDKSQMYHVWVRSFFSVSLLCADYG